jgi:hypothetical protein
MTNAGISRMPPGPTAPVKKPTMTATAASSAVVNGEIYPAAKATSSLVSSTASFFISA